MEGILFCVGILLVLLDRDIGWCVEMNQLFLLYGLAVGWMFLFC